MGASNSRPRFPGLSKSTEGGENARIKYAASSMRGWRPYMEDARAVVPDLDDLTSFFAVYDGHGGADVALLCARQFHTELLNHPDYENNFYGALQTAFFRMDELLQQSDEWKELIKPRGDWIQFLRTGVCANYWPFTQATSYVAPQGTGSTACVVAIRGNQIIVGNVGDSRCVLSRNGQATALSKDHKPNRADEKARIQNAGGRLTRDRAAVLTEGRFQGYRLGAHRINGVLAVSRVIGDFAFKQNKDLAQGEQLAICTPEIIFFDIEDDMEFLVIATDGIWDCMTNKGVVNFVRKYLRAGVTDLRAICERLVDRALPSCDNATAILVQFKSTGRIPPLTESENEAGGRGQEEDDEEDGGGRGSGRKPTLPPVDEGDEDQKDNGATPPAVAKEEEKKQDDEGDDADERRPLLSGEIV